MNSYEYEQYGEDEPQPYDEGMGWLGCGVLIMCIAGVALALLLILPSYVFI